MIELTQSQIVDLFIDKISKNGKCISGTYDKADPTLFEKIKCKLWLNHGYQRTDNDDETGCPGGFPIPEEIDVYAYDCTWGIEFSFTTSRGEEKGYWDRNFYSKPGWYRTTEHFFEVFRDLLILGGTESPYMEDYEHGLSYYE